MTALIVEDEPVSRRMLDAILRKLGHETVLCTDGQAAWDVMQRPGAPSLALIDWLMPGLDGLELCERIRHRSGSPYVYIILVSSKAERADMIAGMAAGADDYISKPVDPEQLELRLRVGQRILDLQAALLQSKETLRDLAMRDALTGVLNRRAIMSALDRTLLRGEHVQQSTAVIMADLDGFKSINDAKGHAVGDIVLREAATRLGHCIRATDHLGRYGGEEFLLVIPESTATSATTLANRVLQRFREEPFETTDGDVSVTLSLGMAIAGCGMETTPSELIAAADAAMYRAKRAGGDGIQLAEVARGQREPASVTKRSVRTGQTTAFDGFARRVVPSKTACAGE